MFLAGCCVKVNEIDEQQSKRKKKKTIEGTTQVL